MTNEQIIEKLSQKQLDLLLKMYGLGIEKLKKIPAEKFSSLLRKIETTDRPALRAAHLRKSLVNNKGELPIDAISKAAKQLKKLRQKAGKLRRVGGMPTGQEQQKKMTIPVAETAGLSATNTGWTALGPGNIGGRTRSIVFNPSNPNIMYAGGVAGGVWKTTDGGANWMPTEDLMANMAVCTLAIDLSNPDTVYAGTGEIFAGDGVAGNGIYKTTDGWSWEVIPTTENNADFQYVNSLAISSDGNTMLAGTATGIFISTDTEHLSWTKKANLSYISNVLFDSSNSSNCIAATCWGRIYYSRDGGNNWLLSTMPNNPNGRITVAYSNSNPNYVYAFVADTTSGVLQSQIWMSTNGGQSFVRRNMNGVTAVIDGVEQSIDYIPGQGLYMNTIWVDPINPNNIIVGALDLYKSTDGGNNLTQISNWLYAPQSAHADQHCIVSHPQFNGTTNKTVYFGNDGGIYMTNDVSIVGTNTNHTNNWIERNNKYAVTQFYGGAGNNTTGTIIGGAQDNGTLSYNVQDGINNWASIFGGDGGYVAADQNDSNYFYGEYIHANIFRSVGGQRGLYISGAPNYVGQSWKSGDYLISDVKPVAPGIPPASEFIAPFVLDPNNSNRILVGGASLWRTNDAKTPNTSTTGPSWASIKTPISGSGAYICSIAICNTNSDLVYVGYNANGNGAIYKSTNATDTAPSWTQVDQLGNNPITAGTKCLSIAIDPNNSQTIYAAFSGYQANNLWKSTNGGAQWTNISQDVVHAPVRSVTIHPNNSNYVYIGTEVGVFASDDGGVNWNPTSEGPTNCAVYDLFWMDTTLVCVTHGRGMFQIDLSLSKPLTALRIGDTAGNTFTIDLITGNAVLGRTRLSGGVYSAMTVKDDLMYIGTANSNYLYSMELSTGNITTLEGYLGGVYASPLIYKDTSTIVEDTKVIVSCANGHLYGYSVGRIAPTWGVQMITSPSPTLEFYGGLIVDNWLYTNSSQGTVAVNLLDKSVGWRTTIPTVGKPLFINGMLFVSCTNCYLYAFDARTGTLLWSYLTANQIATAPVWMAGAIVIGDEGGYRHIVRYDSGGLISRMDMGGAIDMVASTDTMLFIVCNNYLYAYEVTPDHWDLNEIWREGNIDNNINPALIVEGNIYLSSASGAVVAHDIVTGNRLWRKGSLGPFNAPPTPIY